MIVYYISPSVIPSRTANSIHVISMCEALTQLGYKTVLFFKSDNLTKADSNKFINQFYGVNSDGIELNEYSSKTARGVEFFIAILALSHFIIDTAKGRTPKIVIARNLYAALLFGIFLRKKVVYETHSPECGFRKKIQRLLLNSPKIYTVVISNALKKIICEFHCIHDRNIHVFHDAARAGAQKLNKLQRIEQRRELFEQKIELKTYKNFIGYFGHLYAGRGIEVIQGVAEKNPEQAFVIYGGNEGEIKKYRCDNHIKNIFFMGHISPNLAHNAMRLMDILLMPYQKNVSVGLKDVDTSKWMSPMKMFEYLSAGVPIISSDMPVLREILKDGDNAILVSPSDIEAWSNTLRKIINNPDLANGLGFNAYCQYKDKHTWKYRAKGMVDLLL